MRHLARTLATLALPCLALLACQKDPPPPAPPPVMPAAADVDVTATADERRCSVDADCTLATVDCCGCAALGRQTAVRKDKIEALTERRRPICGTIACAQGISEDPSCSAARAVCREGTCVPEAPASGNRGVAVEKIAD